MVISIFITIVTIQQRFWLKIGIIIATLAICVFFVPFKKEFERWGLVVLGVIFVLSYIYNHLRGENAYRTANMYKRLQLVSSASLSIGHGGSDAQKSMGIIGAAMVAQQVIPDIAHVPDWVPFSCYIVIGLGTMSGGWRIVKTMGTRITKVTPLEGVCAETAGAITLFTAANLGAPVSTTHTITGSIVGVGATKRLSAVRWGVTVNLVWAWILTIPVSALLAAGIYSLLKLFF
jgi:PiT family inorganic phosphate transporter